MQIQILSGIYSDGAPNWRTSLPRNLVPVPKDTGISKGYLRPSDGLVEFGSAPGIGRGAIRWNSVKYAVMGTSLVSIDAAGVTTTLADVGGSAQVSLDYSFDRLAIVSDGRLFYWNGSSIVEVTDPDLGYIIDARFIDGYFLLTDGVSLIVTDLVDPTSINPLRYGSAEADPDALVAVKKVLNEAIAVGRYTTETFDNIGGTGFPLQRVEGAVVEKGAIGTHAVCESAGGVAFVGSGRNEPPAVYVVGGGRALKVSTREVDEVLLTYTEAQLSLCIAETRMDKANQHLLIHLPNETLVYDFAASQVLQIPIWFRLTTSIQGNAQYRARNLVWCYDKWLCDDPQEARHGRMVDTVSTHYEAMIGWDFGTAVLYNDGSGAIVSELELVALTGRVPLGADPVIWTSYSVNGQTWSMEKAVHAGKQGDRRKRLVWRRQGRMLNWRVQKFRGTSDAHIAIARLEAQFESLGANRGGS